MKSKIILLLAVLANTYLFSQSKVGTIDSEYIISKMPETQVVLKRAQDYGARLDSSFNIKLSVYKEKVKYYQDNEKTLSDLMKKTKVSELANLEQEIKKYQQNGSQLMQLKQNELMRPLYKKLGEAITEVSKANGFTQILTTTGNQFAYIDDKLDITKLVMDKLGIKEEVKE